LRIIKICRDLPKKPVKMKKILFIFSLSCLFISCKQTAQSIVDEAIEKSGGDKYKNLIAEFDFRKNHYVIDIKDGVYKYTRIQSDSAGKRTVDIMTDATFERKIADLNIVLPDSMVQKYRNSINSVAYFFLLPKPLNDPSVNKELLGEVKIKGKDYYKIKVTFNQEGGGEDFQDIFVYWFEKNSFDLDYLAYSYENDRGGVRFREAYDCKTDKIKYCNYKNYGFEDLKIKPEDLDVMFEKGEIPLKSEIVNENVSIK
jgi:hypothetical protein